MGAVRSHPRALQTASGCHRASEYSEYTGRLLPVYTERQSWKHYGGNYRLLSLPAQGQNSAMSPLSGRSVPAEI